METAASFEARYAPSSHPTCSEASCHSSGCKSHQQRSPVAVVVITSNGKGDRPVGSLVVKVPDGREAGRIRTGGQATWQAVANV
jgi:hypothetical protein